MHIDTSACDNVPCWVYSRENVFGQSCDKTITVFRCLLKILSYKKHDYRV